MVPDTLFVSTLVVMPVLGVAGVVDVVLVVAKVGAGLAILVNGLEQKGLQSRAMHIPRFMRRVNRVLTNPVLGMFAWVVPPLAVVHRTCSPCPHFRGVRRSRSVSRDGGPLRGVDSTWRADRGAT
jgi:hypothetical protein